MPAPLLFVVSGLTQYAGAALAVGLFAVVPAGTVAWLRVSVAAVILLAWRRPWRVRELWEPRRLAVTALFGAVLATMNVTFYIAIQYLPLGTAVAVEFIGPVAVAALTGRGWRDRAAIAVAAVGVVLLAGVSLDAGPGAVTGLVAIGVAAACWGAYIVLGRRVARSGGPGASGLAIAMAAGALVFAPFLADGSGPVLHDARLALVIVAVAVCSSLVPYVLEQVVLRRVSAATFAILLSLLPATAAVVGAVGLRQWPHGLELVGLVLVSGAIALTARGDRADG
ncbi:EamA family transporter [Cellulomonas sp. zg-ZUI222]|uniref:EamA family transporter n=1 Tax=Cellulomonas wangleii TaxID=2816956 RepID=A0ABX8D7E9_9CELL|nr:MULTISPECIES: EamA family transporter [Cellulomonas]MBO0899055.1 EamA family transporter [Cellulomonas sp. zg-ZUI22]MBO0919908.1 EamA family transporter [Cellulomonas wangleii]MBO0923663.1 EamA family transporter [Cellulomonas wangleii]QVI61982.1 EamA family transporter [Cellulomonas wangleii]